MSSRQALGVMIPSLSDKVSPGSVTWTRCCALRSSGLTVCCKCALNSADMF